MKCEEKTDIFLSIRDSRHHLLIDDYEVSFDTIIQKNNYILFHLLLPVRCLHQTRST